MADPADPRIAAAWGNNADLYEAVFTAHGLRYRREPDAFTALDPPPPYYSHLTLLAGPDTAKVMSAVRRLLKREPGISSVKDGNCRLDLAALGFRKLFDARWFWAAADAISPAGNGWRRIETAADLALWESAWRRNGSPAGQHVFVPDILENRKIAIFGRPEGNSFSAGCIANLSPDCVGVSNLFGEPGPAVAANAAVLARDFGVGMPVVGYASGDELAAMLQAGFLAIGPLRIWIRDAAATP